MAAIIMKIFPFDQTHKAQKILREQIERYIVVTRVVGVLKRAARTISVTLAR